MNTYVFVMSGGIGQGKTVTALAYHKAGDPPANDKGGPRRLVIDKEYRAGHYRGAYDDPTNLLFKFDFFPHDSTDMTLVDFEALAKKVRAHDMDVIIFDNMALQQDDIEGWCGDAAGMRRFLTAVDRVGPYDTFLKYRFKDHEPGWAKAMQAGMQGFILLCKKNGVDVVITTELQNKWVNYGSKGRDDNGNPLMKIIGQQAKVWDRTLQMADVNWVLARNKAGKIQTAPTITIDPLRPKMSIVGIPPEFNFVDWDTIWAFATKRNVTTQAQLDLVRMPEVEYSEGEPDTVEQLKAREEATVQAKKEDFLKLATSLGYTLKTMQATLTPLGLYPYDALKEDQMLAALKAAKEAK